MCLILCAYNCHPDYTLVLLSNRDEFYSRPTEPLAIHGTQGDMLCGLDLEGGGTWLAAGRAGRIAALTNVRESGRMGNGAPSRGLLVSRCVQSFEPLPEYLEDLMHQAGSYNGFNLLATDSSGLYYCSNRTGTIRRLPAGLYGLSNHMLDTPWPKVIAGKKLFRDVLAQPGELDCEALFRVLYNDDRPPDGRLPDTGVGKTWERILAPVFIRSDIYGTRTSSVVLLAKDGRLRFVERTHGAHGYADRPGTREYSLSVQRTPGHAALEQG